MDCREGSVGKHLPHKHEDSCSDPQNPCKKPGELGGKTEGPLKFTGQLAKFRPIRDPVMAEGT